MAKDVARSCGKGCRDHGGRRTESCAYGSLTSVGILLYAHQVSAPCEMATSDFFNSKKAEPGDRDLAISLSLSLCL